MVNFTTLYNEYENTKDVCKFCNDYKTNDIATRFLLIRSLDKNNLKDIIRLYSQETTDGNIKILIEKAYNSPVTISQLVLYIENKRLELIRQRELELEGLQDVLAAIPIVNCGVRNDKVDDIIKTFVRNKTLKNIDDLMHQLDNSILPRIKQYSLWSYYNQTSNDIIELFFLRHPAIIPTLRKIHDIDFFIKIEDKIIPFDLKFTHISDSYFDLASQGIIKNTNSTIHDDFYINKNSEISEIKRIKAYYSAFKRKHRELNLPNLTGLEKIDLHNLLISTNNSDATQFIEDIKQTHKKYVPSTFDELYPLEWWNYKYQGERLFCNNNRLFVFLAYTDKFIDGRALKGKTTEIGKRITNLLDNITFHDIHTIKYYYEKDASLEGNYSALAISTIYSE